MLLRQLSYAMKNQLKAPKAPYYFLISCLSLFFIFYGIRAPIIDPSCAVGMGATLLYGIRELAEQHCEPSQPMGVKHRQTSTNQSGGEVFTFFLLRYSMPRPTCQEKQSKSLVVR